MATNQLITEACDLTYNICLHYLFPFSTTAKSALKENAKKDVKRGNKEFYNIIVHNFHCFLIFYAKLQLLCQIIYVCMLRVYSIIIYNSLMHLL